MYNIKTLAFALLFAFLGKANAQTYCMDFDIVSNNGSQLVMNLYLSGDPTSFGLGSSNLVFFFNNTGLGSPMLLSHTIPGNYQPPFLTVPVAGEASLNIELAIGPGKTIGTSPTLIATIQFTILNTSQSTNFSGDYTTPPVPFTVVYTDDEPVIPLQAGNGCPLLDASLPLELLAFRAKAVGESQVDVDWNTAQEREVAGYEVQRSADGHQFVSIGLVAAKNGRAQAYHFVDSKPLPGVSYYRLNMKEAKERSRYSPVEVVRFGQKNTVRAYPNPVARGLEIVVETDLKEAFDVTVTDAAGKQVLRQNCAGGTARLGTAQMPAGIYFYKVESKTSVNFGKLIVE